MWKPIPLFYLNQFFSVQNSINSLFILLFLFPFLSFSQTNLLWSKNLGGSLDDIGTSIFPTNEGGCLITGYSFSNDGDIVQNKGNGDVWMARIDSNGNIQWMKNYGGQGFDKPSSVIKAPDGSIILLYNSRSADSKSNFGGTDCFVVKLSSNGNIIWLKSIGGVADDYGKSIIGDGTGGFYIVGNTLSDFDNHKNIALPDAWLVHINNIGEVLWNKTFGGIHADYFNTIMKHENQLFIVGNSDSKLGQLSNNGSKNAWILATDLDGNEVWSKTYGSSKKDELNDLVLDDNQNILSVGYTFENGNKDIFLVKTNIEGDLIWEKKLGGTGIDETVSVFIHQNKIYLWSNTSSSNGDFETELEGSNTVLSEIDNNGNIEWNTFFGGSQEDVINDATFNENGDLFALGFTQSNDGTVFSNNGVSDIWLLKIGEDIEDEPTTTISLGEPVQICAGNSVEISLEENCTNCSFEWEDGSSAMTRILSPEETSTYLVTITDETGAISVGSVEIEVFPTLEVITLETQISCKGDADGAIELSINGGTGNYDILWSNGSTEQNQYNLGSDIYHVTVSDLPNCSAIANVVLTNPTALSNVTVIENISCFGQSTGQIILSVSGGTSPYEYNWSNNETTSTISELEVGTYMVTITDINGCTKLGNYSINEPSEMTTTITVEHPTNNQSDGSILIVPNGGNPPYEIEWSIGNSGVAVSNLSNGDYTYTLTDSNGCTLIENVLIGTTSNANIVRDELVVQPNPNNGIFLIKNFIGKVELIRLDGRSVFDVQIINLDTKVELPDSINKGIYFLKCITYDNTIQIKKIIVK